MAQPATQLWALDLDRTLLNSEAADALLVDICSAEHIDRQVLVQAQAEMEASGGSFDTFEYMREFGLSAVELQAVQQRYIALSRERDLLYPDAKRFLAELDRRSIPYITLTYGGYDWQWAKLAGVDLTDRPFLIVDQKNKGKIIQGWKTPGGYVPPHESGITVPCDQVVLVDDKAISFADLPTDCAGYLIRRPDERLLPSQAGTPPSNVSTIPDFNSINLSVE